MSVSSIRTALVAGVGITGKNSLINHLSRHTLCRIVPLSDNVEISEKRMLKRLYHYIDKGGADMVINVVPLGCAAEHLPLTLGLIDAGVPVAVVFDAGFISPYKIDSNGLSAVLGVPVFVRDGTSAKLAADIALYIDSCNSYARMCCDPSLCTIDHYVNGCRHCVRLSAGKSTICYEYAEPVVASLMQEESLSRENAIRKVICSGEEGEESAACEAIFRIRKRKSAELVRRFIIRRRASELFKSFFRYPVQPGGCL